MPDLEHLRTAEWAHMLGFRGHFSIKSRAYSTTLGALRTARAEHADQYPAGDTVLIVGHWLFAGLGHIDQEPPPMPMHTTPPTSRERGQQP